MILAIDPGPTHSAYLFMGGDGTIRDFCPKCPNEDLITFIKVREFSRVVIEEIRCFGMSVGKSTFDTCRWTGRFEEAARSRTIPVPVDWVGRIEVKAFWCRSAKASDSNVLQSLKDYYGDKGTKKNPGVTYGISEDAWSALAIAGYWMLKTFGYEFPPQKTIYAA